MERSVTAPSLPINITRIITILPAILSSGVMPVDRPTVPKAETTSKKQLYKAAFRLENTHKKSCQAYYSTGKDCKHTRL